MVARHKPAVLIAAILALGTAAITFVAIPIAAIELAGWWFTRQHPADPSAGDSAMWAVLFSAPLLIAVDVVVSLYAGFFSYRFCYKKCCVGNLPREG